ncbi:uncharacterized protein K460DRAFT_82895 [Cucurbitaria berberidis CBS 394.84]|uniref:Uncharacterized protein n=1 Tax=Cucurbitaria berberidis CBS 394.84 TaxID=1168544 RepID=A0A9P4GM53_9PLEO|nr:uncharacterized protein K460DRAFT_82895 [Cucurbitaria berberidis CBS 394.84]KAF1848928.1 hypothetical protein K460DRAFT_82895 [Cucurbitaria berberidis CBS 394.84]
MGQSMSRTDSNGVTSHHREEGEVSPAYASGMGHNGIWTEPPTAGARPDNGHHIGQSVHDSSGSDCRELPAPSVYPGRASWRLYRQDSPATVAPTPAQGAFDFNNTTQPLPWAERQRDDDLHVMFPLVW